MKPTTFVKSCCLCEEFVDAQSFAYSDIYGINDRILSLSSNFVVVPSVSPLAVGHIMVLPKQHFHSFMSCPSNYKQEAIGIITKVYDKLTELYGPLFIFEHGVANSQDSACGINHAHLHFMPLAPRIAEIVSVEVRHKLGSADTTSVSNFVSKGFHNLPYLAFGTNPLDLEVIFSGNISSQLIRSCIANHTENPAFNWRLLQGKSSFRSTHSDLIMAF